MSFTITHQIILTQKQVVSEPLAVQSHMSRREADSEESVLWPVVAPQAALSPSLVVLPKRSGPLRAQPPYSARCCLSGLFPLHVP